MADHLVSLATVVAGEHLSAFWVVDDDVGV